MISPAQFEEIFPLACQWAEEQERTILQRGAPLSESQRADARRVGVTGFEEVRLLQVTTIRPPEHPVLKAFAEATRLISAGTAGLTLRYVIFIRSDQWSNRALVVHELAHVAQYERFGGIAEFLRPYLAECLFPPGYPNGPLEQEAHRFADEICRTR
jgi:hypothetical protein